MREKLSVRTFGYLTFINFGLDLTSAQIWRKALRALLKAKISAILRLSTMETQGTVLKFTMMLCMPTDISVFSFSTNINLRSEEIRIELASRMTI